MAPTSGRITQTIDKIKSVGFVPVLIYALASVTIIWHMYYAYVGPMSRLQHSNIHLGMLLVAFYLYEIDTDVEGWDFIRRNLTTITMIGIIAISTIFVHLNFFRWLNEAGPTITYTNIDLLIGVLIIFGVIHATWRAYGNVLAGVVVLTLLYGYAGFLTPGVLYHGGISIERLIFMNSISLNGVYFSSTLGIGATWVAIFVFFAGFVEGHGGLDDIVAASHKIGKRIESGFVQTAVAASMMMGSIVGSSAANVATTGSFTIPMMKKRGVPGRYAGAIESMASTAGQILPPVMASAAFLMADLLGISFVEVIRAAFLPAGLFYTTLVFTVVLLVAKFQWGMSDTSTGTEPDTSNQATSKINVRGPFRTTFYYFTWLAPVGVILFALVVLQYGPLAAGFWAIVSLFILTFVRDLSQYGVSVDSVMNWLKKTVEGGKIGVINMAPLTAVLAALGIVVQIISRTGFTQRFSLQMIGLAGGLFLIVLILVMLTSIFFGLGMPTPAAYIVVALIAAPAMIELGVETLVAHLFVLYFAVLSTITPPVAVSCAVAAGIADADFIDTAILTVRIGLYAFIIPFAFIQNPELVMWDGATTAVVFVIVMIGLWIVSVGLIGHNLQTKISAPVRVLYLLAGSLVIFVPILAVQGALALLLALLLIRNTTSVSKSLSSVVKG